MEQQWHEPRKLNNENNLQLKSCKKENKKKRNQGKAKCEKKLFFGPSQVGVTGLSQYLP